MPHILEADKPLSQSLLWQIQRAYFEATGIGAWREDVVPHSISCSPYLARAYADVIRGYLRDLLATEQLKPNQPVYVVELGAGSGRLSYHLHQQLAQTMAQAPFDALDLRFVLTDFAQSTIDFWTAHPSLQALTADGVFEFACFDAMAPQPLRLVVGDQVLDSAEIHNPIILLANYFFDSIPQDSFVLADGLAQPNLLTLLSSQPEPDLSDPTLWDRLTLDYEALPIEQPYADPLYNDILAYYADTLPETRISFPNKGLDCLDWWIDYANGDVLLLTADRGHTLLESLLDQPDPLPNLHGSFSLMVNYHAIGLYTAWRNGLPLQLPHYQNNLQVGAFLFGDAPAQAIETQRAFLRSVVEQSPDDFFALREMVIDSAETLTLPQLLSALRLSAYDADLFQQLIPRLHSLLATASEAWHGDVAATVQRVVAQYLPLRDDDPLYAQAKTILTQLHATL